MSDSNEKVTVLLSELRKISGLPLSLESSSDSGLSDSVTEKRLSELIELCRNADERNSFYTNFLSGTLSDEEITLGCAKYHISTSSSNFSVYAVGFKNPYSDIVTEILTGLFPVSKNVIVRINRTFIAIICFEAPESDETAEKTTAMMIVDTLRGEAMTDAKVGFDRPVKEFVKLAPAFQNAVSAIKISSLFSLEDNPISYRNLGLNKLLSQIPESVIKEYMEDEFHGFSFNNLSTESTNTIKTLFDNGLNIAETARALYLHRNTLVYRLEKFHKESGMDLRLFDDAVKCKTGMMLNELLKNKEKFST